MRAIVALVAVVAGTLAGGWLALDTYNADRTLSVGTVRLSVEPGHRGALDVYVPLVDWGARFDVIRVPARLSVDVRTVDRRTAGRIAQGAELDLDDVRAEARDGIASYLRILLGITFATALGAGVLVALAVRSRAGPRVRWLLGAAVVTAAAGVLAFALLLQPRGSFSNPEYYANGADVPRALEAFEQVQRSTRALDEELNAQLVGLARLVIEPSRRTPLEGRPQFTVASDVHNNALALGFIERTAQRGPLFFPGDLTDRGSPLEEALVRRVVRAGRPFVFVTGNHDSDVLARRLAGRGAIVLTQFGRLRPDGRYGPMIARVGSLRVAGYRDVFERRAADGYRDRYVATGPTDEQKAAFADWATSLLGRVDVIMVHDVRLAEQALERLSEGPPVSPLVLLTGHTHRGSLRRQPGVTILDPGSAGAGGTGNLADAATDLGVARLVYEERPRFRPLAADLVRLSPATGSSTAERVRLDEG